MGAAFRFPLRSAGCNRRRFRCALSPGTLNASVDQPYAACRSTDAAGLAGPTRGAARFGVCRGRAFRKEPPNASESQPCDGNPDQSHVRGDNRHCDRRNSSWPGEWLRAEHTLSAGYVSPSLHSCPGSGSECLAGDVQDTGCTTAARLRAPRVAMVSPLLAHRAGSPMRLPAGCTRMPWTGLRGLVFGSRPRSTPRGIEPLKDYL
jgi:hypothetical protein